MQDILNSILWGVGRMTSISPGELCITIFVGAGITTLVWLFVADVVLHEDIDDWYIITLIKPIIIGSMIGFLIYCWHTNTQLISERGINKLMDVSEPIVEISTSISSRILPDAYTLEQVESEIEILDKFEITVPDKDESHNTYIKYFYVMKGMETKESLNEKLKGAVGIQTISPYITSTFTGLDSDLYFKYVEGKPEEALSKISILFTIDNKLLYKAKDLKKRDKIIFYYLFWDAVECHGLEDDFTESDKPDGQSASTPTSKEESTNNKDDKKDKKEKDEPTFTRVDLSETFTQKELLDKWGTTINLATKEGKVVSVHLDDVTLVSDSSCYLLYNEDNDLEEIHFIHVSDSDKKVTVNNNIEIDTSTPNAEAGTSAPNVE